MKIIDEERSYAGVKELCHAYGISESSYYRGKQAEKNKPIENVEKNIRHWRQLEEDEEKKVLETLTSERFIDMAPNAIVATILDDGEYLCSTRTMYRILKRNASIKERRDQRRHPEYTKPELLATKPNQVWSWDITKLKTGRKWEYHYLYVIMDIYSRAVVGWTVAPKESAVLAEQLMADCVFEQGILPGQLTIHADRGAAMTSKTVSQLLADLGVTRTHSRPHVSNDNPYSESQFKTLKYHSKFPKAFSTLEEAKLFLLGWFNWYNNEHRHSGIQMLTPSNVHSGKALEVIKKRQAVIDAAYQKRPSRFPNGRPRLPTISGNVWINMPKKDIS